MATTSAAIPPLTVSILTRQWLVWYGLQKTLESSVAIPMVVRPHHRSTPDRLPKQTQADVFILDLETVRNACGTIKQIRESAPISKIVLLCGLHDNDRTCEAFAAGVDGIILIVQPPPVILAAIEVLYVSVNPQTQREQAGPEGMDPINKTVDVEAPPLKWPQTLTKREQEIIQLVRQGLSNKDIAYSLSISDSTVRHHMTSIFEKVGVPNRQKLIVHTHFLHTTHPGSHEHPPTMR
ncbi:MAG: response regulator transcription factor [Nitrospira sp.]|nr:response regulator transcription factor [Nitrospira sp.]